MRRHLRKLLFGVALVAIISPSDCVFNYCIRHDFNPPICNEIIT